ncbi:hypothetical protein [Nocardia salmonicida]|uniref:hypothetical protein n=1 Tax=Nocardia salmonicida TaxID=53431 RepID=UPI00363A3422
MLTRTLTASLTALAATALLTAGPAIAAPAPTAVADIETGSESTGTLLDDPVIGGSGHRFIADSNGIDSGSWNAHTLRDLACSLAILAGSSFSLTATPPAVCLLPVGA